MLCVGFLGFLAAQLSLGVRLQPPPSTVMIGDFLFGDLAWLPDSFGRGVGRVFRALAHLPVVVAVGIVAIVGMIWSWPGILRGSGLAIAVWFVAPLFAIGVAIAWSDRQSTLPSNGSPAA
jgi:hypothetical protein